MPIFRIGRDLHFYAHVPKCAGTSIELYLESRFGRLGFVNRRYMSDPVERRWSRTSPQHVPLFALNALIPEDWIASSFAVVRHPVTRVVSAFGFQRDVEGTVPDDWSVDRFFDDWLAREAEEPFLYDGHLTRQSTFVPKTATIFPIEDGLQDVVSHLDGLAGNTGGPRQIPEANTKKGAPKSGDAGKSPSPQTIAAIETYYSRDFERFGYASEAPARRAPAAAPAGWRAKLKARLSRR